MSFEGRKRRARAIRRIQEATLRVERQPRNTLADARYSAVPPLSHCYVFVAGSVSAISGATLGSGTGLLCSRSSSDVLTPITPNVTIHFKNAATAFTGPKYISLQWNTSAWEVGVAAC